MSMRIKSVGCFRKLSVKSTKFIICSSDLLDTHGRNIFPCLTH